MNDPSAGPRRIDAHTIEQTTVRTVEALGHWDPIAQAILAAGIGVALTVAGAVAANVWLGKRRTKAVADGKLERRTGNADVLPRDKLE